MKERLRPPTGKIVITEQKLDLRIGEPMQICIHRKDNSPKPVYHRLTLKGWGQGQI